METEKHIIIHHADCFDGVAGAWVIKAYLQQTQPSCEIRIIPAIYGQDPPDIQPDEHVWIVDFSYPRPVMEKLIASSKLLTCYDHHKTAQEALAGLPGCFFDMNRCGSTLAFSCLFPTEEQPGILDFIEDRDLWRLERVYTKQFIAALASRPLTIETMEIANRHWWQFVDEGAHILRYIQTYGQKLSETFTLRSIAGYKVPVINCPYMNISDHLATLHQRMPDAPFVAAFFMRNSSSGPIWQFSLRSKGDFDVSGIAKKFGGGGHKNAAGFQVESLSDVGW